MGVAQTLTLALCVGAATAHASPTEVVLVKRAGVNAYEEVADAFREGCRVQARFINLDAFTPSHFGASQLVITVGQEAFDAVKAAPGREIAVLAFHVPDDMLGPPAVAAPDVLLRAIVTARPAAKIIGVVYGARSKGAFEAARDVGRKLGLELRGVEAENGPAAVRALRGLVDSVQALWLPFDTDILTPQLFQYALRLQIERGLPIAAATRQQVKSGALLAVDYSARDAGHMAADLANGLLEGRPAQELAASQATAPSGARITVNSDVARRLGADLPALEKLGARIE